MSDIWRPKKDHIKEEVPGVFEVRVPRYYKNIKDRIRNRISYYLVAKLEKWGVIKRYYVNKDTRSYEKVTVNLEDVRDALYKSKLALEYLLNEQDVTVIVGIQEYSSLLKDATSFMVDVQYMNRGVKMCCDAKVLLVPWFEGVLPIPTKRILEAVGGGECGIPKSYSSGNVVERYISDGSAFNPWDEGSIPRR